MFDAFLQARLARFAGLSDFVFRVTLSLIFLIGGIGHFMRSDEMLKRLLDSPWLDQVMMIGDPLALLHLSGAVFIIGSLFMIAGYSTRLAALAMFITLVPITFTIHIAPGHEGPLFKNIAILGALFYVCINGAKCCALDLRRRT
jgi:putative oxidoreductase